MAIVRLRVFLNSEVKSAETRADLMFWSLDVARVSLLKSISIFANPEVHLNLSRRKVRSETHEQQLHLPWLAKQNMNVS
jgi:hypothetical protein